MTFSSPLHLLWLMNRPLPSIFFFLFANRATTAHRRSDESIELQPLQGPKTPKGVLRRMQRVKSEDNNADDEDCSKDDVKQEEKITSPIGAGLPLLQRLRLLKEKQVRFDALTVMVFIYHFPTSYSVSLTVRSLVLCFCYPFHASVVLNYIHQCFGMSFVHLNDKMSNLWKIFVRATLELQ